MYHDMMSGETSRVYMWEMCRIRTQRAVSFEKPGGSWT